MAITREAVMLVLPRMGDLALTACKSSTWKRWPANVIRTSIRPRRFWCLGWPTSTRSPRSRRRCCWPIQSHSRVRCWMMQVGATHPWASCGQVTLASGADLWIAPLASPGEYAALQDVVARAARAGRLPVG